MLRELQMILLLLISSFTLGQYDAKGLTGKWAFQSTELSAQMEPSMRTMIEGAFVDMFLFFRKDGSYKARLASELDQGSWQVNSTGQVVELASDLGDIITIAIVGCNKNRLSLDMRMIGRRVNFNRVKPNEDDKISMQLRELKLDTASASALQGRWLLERLDDPSKSPEREEQINNSLDGSFIEFGTDGGLKRKLSKFEEHGAWRMMKNKSTVEIDMSNSRQRWNIIEHKIGERLTLVKGRSPGTYYFVREAK